MSVFLFNFELISKDPCFMYKKSVYHTYIDSKNRMQILVVASYDDSIALEPECLVIVNSELITRLSPNGEYSIFCPLEIVSRTSLIAVLGIWVKICLSYSFPPYFSQTSFRTRRYCFSPTQNFLKMQLVARMSECLIIIF